MTSWYNVIGYKTVSGCANKCDERGSFITKHNNIKYVYFYHLFTSEYTLLLSHVSKDIHFVYTVPIFNFEAKYVSKV